MNPEQNGYPLTLHLPDGTRAEYVPGSRPPQYEVAGEPCAVDVTIPDDLVATGWYWFGSYVSNGEIGLFTGIYGVAGAFDQARIHQGLRPDRQPQIIQLQLFDMAA